MNANVKCFILCIYKTILKPSKQFLTVSNHKVFSLHALWMTILRPSRQLLTVSNHQVFRFYTLLKLSKVFHPSICSSFVLNLRWLLLRVSRWITNMLVLSKYLLTVKDGYPKLLILACKMRIIVIDINSWREILITKKPCAPLLL